MTRDIRSNRRQFLKGTVAVGTALSVAGCSLVGDGDSSGGDLSVGDTVQGEITEDSPNDPIRNELSDPYTFAGSEGQTIRISQTSEEIDCYLVVTDGNGNEVARNDDGGSGFDSQLTMMFPADGTYTIWAGSFRGNETGNFTLSVSEFELDDTDTISVGETITGTIQNGSPIDPVRTSTATPVTLQGSEGDTVQISQSSEEIDCYLVVTDENGNEVARNDDGGSGFDSQLTATFPADGTYTIWAGSFSGSGTGTFTLSVSEASMSEPITDNPESISVGETVSGGIQSTSPEDPVRNSLAAPITLQGNEGQTIQISQSSEEIDCYLVVTDENGNEVARNDDGGSGFDSQLTTTLQSGTYTIWAGSWSRSDTGRFTLSVESA